MVNLVTRSLRNGAPGPLIHKDPDEASRLPASLWITPGAFAVSGLRELQRFEEKNSGFPEYQDRRQ